MQGSAPSGHHPYFGKSTFTIDVCVGQWREDVPTRCLATHQASTFDKEVTEMVGLNLETSL